jgi:hypothetical protein
VCAENAIIFRNSYEKQTKKTVLRALAPMDNLLANSMVWSVTRPYAFRVEADFVTCTQWPHGFVGKTNLELALREFHELHPNVALALNVTRRPFSFLGQQPADVDDGNSDRWGGFPRLKRRGIWHDRLTDYSGSPAGRDEFEAHMARLGEAAGLKFDFDVFIDRQPIESQRLLLWAARFGKG